MNNQKAQSAETANKIENTSQSGGLSSVEIPERIGEILFGLIMVLTFTGSLSVSEAGREDVREMLIGALGCNLAWGIIDALFYLMNCITDRGRKLYLLNLFKKSSDAAKRKTLLLSAVPEWIRQTSTPEHLHYLEERLIQFDPNKEARGWRIVSDIRDSFYIFVLVFLSTFPVAIPFIVIKEPALALRLSNLIAVLLLFASGYTLGRYSGQKAIIWGVCTALIGVVVVSFTIALGG